MRTRPLLLLPAALLGLTIAACGSDDGDGKAGGRPDGTPDFALTTDLGCGYGFARVDDGGTALLTIYHEPGHGKVDGLVTLPDPGWTAQIEVGKHLDANWCSDVIIDPQAQAQVEETYAVVEGTLGFRGEVPHFDGRQNDQPVRAELTGVVVEGPDGDRIEVGDIPLSNDSFGFFAG